MHAKTSFPETNNEAVWGSQVVRTRSIAYSFQQVSGWVMPQRNAMLLVYYDFRSAQLARENSTPVRACKHTKVYKPSIATHGPQKDTGYLCTVIPIASLFFVCAYSTPVHTCMHAKTLPRSADRRARHNGRRV